MFSCKFCKREFDAGSQLGGHVVFCQKNPNRDKTRKKLREIGEKNSQNSRSDRENKSKLLLETKTLSCQKCKTQYELTLRKREWQSGKYKKHCSRTCANSHVVTQEHKQKISKSLAGRPFVERRKIKPKYMKSSCIVCGFEFEHGVHRKRKTCSKLCLYKHNSNSRKLQYRNGRKQAGGKTKWYVVKTLQCNVTVQGSFEVRACHILDGLLTLNLISSWSRNKRRYRYIDKKHETHLYQPDFVYVLPTGQEMVLEVKGYKRETDDLKWCALNENFVVWFKKDLLCLEQNLIFHRHTYQ